MKARVAAIAAVIIFGLAKHSPAPVQEESTPAATAEAAPENVVRQYFDAVNRRDLIGAYNLTSVAFHNRIGQERYAKLFFATYRVEVEKLEVHSNPGQSALVAVELREFDQQGHATNWLGDINVVLESGNWRIESMKGLNAAPSANASTEWAGELYPETRTKLLTPADISGWSAEKLRYAINEMYARGGYDFRTPEIKQIFLRMPWYSQRLVIGRTQEEAESHFSALEKANLETLQKARHAKR